MNPNNSSTVSRSDWRSGPPAVTPLAGSHTPPTLVMAPIRWCFLLFVFSIAFEYVDFGFFHGYFTITKAAGFLLVGAALLQASLCFAWPPKAFWFFLTYLGVYSLRALIRLDFGVAALSMTFTLVQCLILFWISFNILQSGSMQKGVYVAFVLSNTVVALLTYVGIAAAESLGTGGVRGGAFGQNLNIIAFLYAVGVLSAVALVVDKTVPLLARLSMIPMILLMGAKCAATGSRGGMLSLAVGLLAYGLTAKGLAGRIKGIFVVGALAAVLGNVVLSTDIARERWNLTLETGDTASRNAIFRNALEMFLERPFFGWGPTTNLVELANRENSPGEYRDTHNDIMFVLTATGLAGGVFFIGGLSLCVWGAWKGRSGPAGPFPFALLLAVLLLSMTGSLHWQKSYWVILSMAGASGAVAASLQTSKAVRQTVQGSLQR